MGHSPFRAGINDDGAGHGAGIAASQVHVPMQRIFAKGWGTFPMFEADAADILMTSAGPSGPGIREESVMKESAIKVGVIAEETGPLSFMGLANANVARMVVNDINARGGLLGREVVLILEEERRPTASRKPRQPSSSNTTRWT